MAIQVHLYRPLARNHISIGADAEAHDLRTNWRDYRVTDMQSAGVHRRKTELGLSLYLDSRCRLHIVRLVEDRVHGGGARLHAMAGCAIRGGRGGRTHADCVWN